MYAHAHECTSMHVKGAENPHKALELRVLLSWALHLLGKGEDVGGFDTAVFVALVGVHRSLLRVHLLDLVNGLASACGEQRNVKRRGLHAAPSAKWVRFRPSQIVSPAWLLCIAVTGSSEAVGRTQRKSCRRRCWCRHTLLRTRRDPHTPNSGGDQVGHIDTGLWAGLRCAQLAKSAGT